jgi:hypothetical protein
MIYLDKIGQDNSNYIFKIITSCELTRARAAVAGAEDWLARARTLLPDAIAGGA